MSRPPCGRPGGRRLPARHQRGGDVPAVGHRAGHMGGRRRGEVDSGAGRRVRQDRHDTDDGPGRHEQCTFHGASDRGERLVMQPLLGDAHGASDGQHLRRERLRPADVHVGPRQIRRQAGELGPVHRVLVPRSL